MCFYKELTKSPGINDNDSICLVAFSNIMSVLKTNWPYY